jgi:acetyl-CoA carboxylase biotin carboxylase subunit
VRVDSHIAAGAAVPPYYDSMIAKLIVHGQTRHEAMARLKVALSEMRVEGVATNLALHRRILDEPGFIEGGFDIHYLEQLLKAEASA